MAELEWIESRFQKFCYLYAQATGNLAGVAYREYLELGTEVDPKEIAQLAAEVALAGLDEIEFWRDRVGVAPPQDG